MCTLQYQQKHCSENFAIMDSGNNKRHSFRSPAFFPNGVRTHTVSITGVHGVKQVKVGIGVAKFRTKCTDGSVKEWLFPGSILNTESPVNCCVLIGFITIAMKLTQGMNGFPSQKL